MLFDQLHGLPDRKADIQAGLIASLLVNINAKKGSKKVRPKDFFPWLDQAQQSLSVEEKVRQWAAAMGAAKSAHASAPDLGDGSAPLATAASEAPSDDDSNADSQAGAGQKRLR